MRLSQSLSYSSDVLSFNPVTPNESDQLDLTCLPFLFPPCSTHVKASIISLVAVWPVSARRDWNYFPGMVSPGRLR